jgi:hypothetical protein
MTRGTVRAWALVVGGALVALTTACGGSSGSGSPGGDAGAFADGGGDGGGVGPTAKVTVDVTGAVSVKGTAPAPPESSNGKTIETCADYAKGETGDDGDSTFRLPQMLKQAVSGKQVQVFAVIKDYKGPGTYPIDQISDVAGEPGIGVDGKQYFLTSDATATATVDSNGGGKWQFTNLTVQNNDNTQTSGRLSGSVTWTCDNG